MPTIIYKGESVIVEEDGTIIWNGRKRNHHLNADGYPVVSIKTDKGWRAIGVARLIATAFIPNPQNLPEVDHINYNRQDYGVENLRWVSHLDNIRHSIPNQKDKHGENNPNFGNHKLSQFYKENPDVCKKNQSRPGAQNGRYIHGKYSSVKV